LPHRRIRKRNDSHLLSTLGEHTSMAKKNQRIKPRADGYLFTMIADEDTITGFLLSGIGNVDATRKGNFLVVDPKTTKQQIKAAFEDFISREDVGVVLISQTVADDIRYLLDDYDQLRPSILEIPSKGHPYDPIKDSMMQRIRRLLGRAD